MYDTTSNGFLRPQLTHHFRVLFLNDKNELLSCSDTLSRQVIAVSPYLQTSPRAGEAQVEKLFIRIEEDVCNLTQRAIQDLLGLDNFTLRLQMLDGTDKVTKTTDITDAWLSSVMHSQLDYGAGKFTEQLIARLQTPLLNGNKLEELRSISPIAELIYTILSHSRLDLINIDKDASNLAVQPLLEINYSSDNVTVIL